MTERKLSDYLPFYLGCEVEYEGVLNGKELKAELQANKHDVFYIPKIQEIKGMKRGFLREIRVSQDGSYTVCKVGRRGLKSFWGVPDFKLVLRPLSDMTEEDVISWGDVTVSHTPYCVELDSKDDFGEFTEIYPDGSILSKSKDDGEMRPINGGELFRLLLSKGFDLFNLIPDGLAIDKSTLKP